MCVLPTGFPYLPALAWTKQQSITTNLKSSSSVSHVELHNDTSLIIVDVNNVRGKSHFQWTHEGLIERAIQWRNTRPHGGGASVPLALVVDHGNLPSLHTSGPLDDRVGIFFSGPKKKADDVIVSLIRDCDLKTMVVTADQDLKARCRQVSHKLDFSDPIAFLHYAETFVEHDYVLQLDENKFDPGDCDNVNNAVGDSVRREVVIRQELQMLNRLLNPKTRTNGKKRQVSRKQRTKLVRQRDRARHRLHVGLLLGGEETNGMTLSSVLETNSNSTTLNGVVQAMKRGSTLYNSVESTYERQLLAERLRRRLVRAGTTSCQTDDYKDMSSIRNILLHATKDSDAFINGDEQKPSGVHEIWNRDGRSLSSSVLTVPRRFHRNTEDAPSTLLRIVAISDTHGYEHELFHYSVGGEEPHLLPPADVLIHCGDFSGSGSRKMKLQSKARLDAFLAAQTHIPTKIVLRGNHDPLMPARALFPRSQAMYLTKLSTVTLPYNVTLGVLPFSRRRDISLLPHCDILATHEPPYGILDVTYQRLRAGSMSLRHAVEASSNKPSLWLCGHIHESRGSVMHTFVNERTTTAERTLVINAANSNAGQANRIVSGPVLVDVLNDMSSLANSTTWRAGLSADDASPVTLDRPDSLEAMVSSMSKTFRDEVSVPNRRLLAVDLGLRTATAVLDGSGQILQVDDWRFKDLHQLEGALEGILCNHSITHVVVEGADMKLNRIWRLAVEKYDLPFARVVAEDWREVLLLPKERKNKQAAKDAAVLIAKQFLTNKLDHNNSSAKLSKDAAEAVLVGLYALQVLGWAKPVVKRYGNGNVMRI